MKVGKGEAEAAVRCGRREGQGRPSMWGVDGCVHRVRLVTRTQAHGVSLRRFLHRATRVSGKA